MNKAAPMSRIGFFTSPQHPCGYLEGIEATTLFADPRVQLNTATYSRLSAHGFRRSGAHVYRPHCMACRACTAVRVNAAEFVPRRIHRRTLQKNADISVVECADEFSDEQFALYEAYLNARHPDSQMEAGSPDAYLGFLTAPWTDTSFYEFRLADELVAVAVVDKLNGALSSVYTFFSPQYPERSLGRLAILKQIEWARIHRLSWVYLGYWIEQSPKMAYKNEYQPLEYFYGGTWQPAPASGCVA